MLLGQGEKQTQLVERLVGMDRCSAEAIPIPGRGSRLPVCVETVEARQHFLRLDGREVFRFASEAFPCSVRELVERRRVILDDLALFVPHDANPHILEAGVR